MRKVILGSFRRLGLQRRIMLYVSTGLVIFSAIYGVVALHAIQDSSDLVFRERLLVARAIGRELDDSLSHFQGDLQDSAARMAPALAANDRPAAQDSLHNLYNHWATYHHIESPYSVSLTDIHGTVLWSEPNSAGLIGRNLQSPSSLRVAFETSGRLMAEDGALLVLAAPIQSNQETLGFVVGAIDEQHLGNLLDPDLRLAEPGYSAELIDSSGVVIAGNDHAKEFGPSAHQDLVAALLASGQSGVRTHTIQLNGTEFSHVIAFAPLMQLPWGVVIEQRQDEALILPHHLTLEFAGFGLLALLGGLALAWLTTQTVVHPVNALIRASKELARGDLDHPLDIGGTDEVGTLARTFDDMRLHLKQSRAEIAQWNHELEARVAERTRELTATLAREEQRTRELTALVASSHALTSTLELNSLFDILMQATRSVQRAAEGIALFMFEPDNQALRVRSTFGFDAQECLQLRFRPDEAISGKIFASHAPTLLHTTAAVRAAQANLSEENRTHFQRAVGERTAQSALGVPLVAKGAQLGALILYNFSRESAFADSEIPVLQALADQASTAIENARLYQAASEIGALRELNRIKSDFVARASHELRTPLAGIKRLAEILLRRDLTLNDTTRQEFLQEIDRSSDRLARIVEQLLSMERIEAGRLNFDSEPVAVDKLITRMVSQLHLQYPTRSVQVMAALDLAPAWGDAERLEDVLTNLQSNALKYSDADKPVMVRAERQNGHVTIAVCDQGIGIPSEVQPRIFERFYRVDNAVTRRVSGAGLGLYICKKYVEAMGGSIRFESEPGRGSTFAVSLPLDGPA